MSMEPTQIGPARRCIPFLSKLSAVGSLTVNVGFHSRYIEERGVEMSTL